MLLKLTAPRLWLAICLLLTSTFALAQKSVNGKVTDANNQPIAGASVTVKGSTSGTTTDDQGAFSINVPNENSTLVVSYVGFATQEFPVRGLTTLNVTLSNSQNSLNEVIVTGYTTQQRKNITGAVAAIKGTQLQSVPSGNV